MEIDYISDKFREDFPEHFGKEVEGIDGRTLYQYQKIEDEYIETIIQASLYVSNPERFNDPFDCWGLLENDLGEDKDIRVSILESSLLLGVKKLGIICFTSSWDNQLMWSHYANSHKGMCVGYEFSDSSWKGADDFILRPVQYEKFMPIQMSEAWDDERELLPFQLAATSILRAKNPDWHYEREWRIMCRPAYREKRVELDQLGVELKEVIFGKDVPDWKITATTQAITSSGVTPTFSKIRFDRELLRLVKDTFDVYR